MNYWKYWCSSDNLRQNALNKLGATMLVPALHCVYLILHAATLHTLIAAFCTYLGVGLGWVCGARGVDQMGRTVANMIHSDGYPDAATLFQVKYSTAHLSFRELVPYWVGIASICVLVSVLTWHSVYFVYHY